MLESVIISTLAGSFVCTVLLIFKNRILAILGGKALYYLSLGAMLIFMLPLNIGDISLSQTTAVGITEFSANETAPPAVIENAVSEEALTVQATPPPQTEIHPKAPDIVRRSNPVTIQEILIAAWLTGFMLSLGRYFISYFRFKKRICGFEVYKSVGRVRIITSPLITSPMIFGFFKPTLAVPQCEMDESDYQLAIRHEMMHYCHHDSWFKLFAVFVNSLCWFNPITYLMVNLIGEACEYACDEAVVKEMDADGRKQYSEMILSMVCQSSPALSSNMAKSKQQLKRRFEMIMKKKKSGVFKSLLCTAMMLSVLCGGVVLANETAPLVSSLIKDDYVYISNYGNHNYNEFVPVEKDGVYYLPLREFLNKSDIENDKIKYDNGKITIDFWTNDITVYSNSVFAVDGETKLKDAKDREIVEKYPAEYSWSSICTIGSQEIEIDRKKYSLKNSPYIENGITYAPYEYFQLLSAYEDEAQSIGNPIKQKTSKFVSLLLFGYNSSNAEYYTDFIQMEHFINHDSYAYSIYNARAKVSKTGYRTEFEAEYDYFDINYPHDRGNVKIKLNKVNRIYSKGSDIEGFFTVFVDGEMVYDNEKGYITNLPIPAGEGVLTHSTTFLKIGEIKVELFFHGFGNVSTELNEAVREKGNISEEEDTEKLMFIPETVKLNGYTATRGSKMYNRCIFNKSKKMIDINLHFDNYIGQDGQYIDFYRIHSEVDSKMNVIDENTFTAELYFTLGNNSRIDSFDAIITLLPDNRFELKSTDGNYIVRGTVKEFVPQWQWSEEEKNAPVPQVIMINE